MIYDIEHENTEKIVCPHCGFEVENSWQFDESNIKSCFHCNEEYVFNRVVEVRYHTRRIFCKHNGHKWELDSLWKNSKGSTLWRRYCTECERTECEYDPLWATID